MITNTNTPSQATPTILEVTERTFATDVLKRSEEVPVLVDFWADWCGPCHMLAPVLERLVTEFKGAFILAKVNVDHNPNLSMKFGVQGIPAVKAFYNRKIINEFSGALPEPQVRQFIQKILPSKADLYAQQAYQWETSGQLAMAVTNYKQALTEQEDHYHAMIGLGRSLLKQNNLEEGLDILNKIPADMPERSVADALIATAQFHHLAAEYTEQDLQAKIKANANDLDSRYALGCLLATENRFEQALEAFLEIIRRNRTYNDGAARKAMLALFTTIGAEHPLVSKYQQQLANALF